MAHKVSGERVAENASQSASATIDGAAGWMSGSARFNTAETPLRPSFRNTTQFGAFACSGGLEYGTGLRSTGNLVIEALIGARAA